MKDVQRMIEKQVWIIIGAEHGSGVDIAPAAPAPGIGVVADEPSHIHIPRPIRVTRPDAAAVSREEARG